MLTVEMTSIPASSRSSMSCHRFSWRPPGTFVWASSSTRTCAGAAPARRRRRAPRGPSRGTRPSGEVRPRAPRTGRAVLARPWVSTNPTTTSVPRVGPPPPLVEHGEGLADARGGTEVDAEPAPSHGPVPTPTSSSVDVHHEDVDGVLPEEVQGPPRGVVVDHGEDVVELHPSLVGDARCLEPGVGQRDVRVEPGARCGHGVDGDRRVVGEAVLLAVGGDGLLDGGEEVRVRRPEVRARRRRAVVALAGRRGPRVEVLAAP